MNKKRWILLILSIILFCGLSFVWYLTYFAVNRSSDINKHSDYTTQRYKNQWYDNLEELYKSDWYREKYQECIDSYKDKHCGIPEEMCTLDRLISGNFCY